MTGFTPVAKTEEKVYIRHSERRQLLLKFMEANAPAFESGLWKIKYPVDDEGRIVVEFDARLPNRLSAGASIIPANDERGQSVLFLDQYGDDNGFMADLTPEELTKALLEQAGMQSLHDKNGPKERMDLLAFVMGLLLTLWIASAWW